MKDVFIVNPKSGKNNQYELIKEIKEHFQGKRIIIEKTKGPEHATFIAKSHI
jgi:diacylglycerol kinase (ATP)